jgi:predicted nucleic acid-binding protein
MRIRLETDAYYLILNGIQSNNYEMMVSRMHFNEIESIEDIRERIQVVNLLDIYGNDFKYNFKRVKERAVELIFNKFGIADSVHLAFAEQSSDYLITCDYKFLKKSKKIKAKIEVINPIEFCSREELK